MIIIWIFIGLIVIGAGFSIFGLSVVYKNPIQPHQETPDKLGIAFQEVRFPTRNNCRLYGWWIPAENQTTINYPTLILVHGWGRNVARMMTYVQHLQPLGYNLLIFDARNHGSSDRDGHSTMVKFAEDILAAVDFVYQQLAVDSERIGVVGLSIGGSASLYAASLDSRIKGVVTIGAFSHPEYVIRLEFNKRHVPYIPFVWFMIKYFEFRIGKRMDEIAPLNTIANTPARILIIHGEQDAVIPIDQGKRLSQEANPQTVTFWQIADKGHSDCHRHPQFWSKLHNFFKESL